MKIALAQLDVKPGRMRENFAKLSEMLWEAKRNGAGLVAFPEMCLTGYLLGDMWTDDSFCRQLPYYDDKIRELSRELDIIVVYGNLFSDNSKVGNDGRTARYNAVYCCERGNFHVRFKTLLPSYRVFDDHRYFLSGGIEAALPVRLENGLKLGLEICEDMWWEDYGENITQILTERGADIIINISASPFSLGKSAARDNRVRNIKEILRERFVPFFYLNCTGVQNNGKNIITFDGGSRIYNRDAHKTEARLAPYEEGILYAEVKEGDVIGNAAEEEHISPTEQKYNAIIRAYKGVDEMLGSAPSYIFGLSGGVDSSVSAALARLSLGADRIKGYGLPSKYNSDATKESAKKLAERLGVAYKIIPIDKFMEATEFGIIPPLAEENLQARMRGNILQTLAALENGVVVSNANKLETALGYCTLYGDTVGAFSPIGDLTKTEVWEMARFINKTTGWIPEELIPDENFECAVMPSAELKENQLDPMKWGYHDRLLEAVMSYKKMGTEDFLRRFLEGTLCSELSIPETLFKRYGLDNPKVFVEDLEWFMKSIRENVFKRVQSPPIVILSKSSFGYDFRESQLPWEESPEHTELKKQILTSKCGQNP